MQDDYLKEIQHQFKKKNAVPVRIPKAISEGIPEKNF